MKKLLFICLLSNCLSAQDWQTIPHSYFGHDYDYLSEPQFAYKHFKINPYNNEIWINKGPRISRIDNQGTYFQYTTTNTPIFTQSYSFLDFAFTPQATFASRAYMGFYKFENDNWEQLLGLYESSSIIADADTVWLTSSDNNNYYKWYDNNLIEGNYAFFRRTANKNGAFWGSSGDAFINYFYNDIATGFDPDTCKLLNIEVYDFKFSKKTDTLFVSGPQGISLAKKKIFIDSIDRFSSFDMPLKDTIIEFEFDLNDNIWALFGSYYSPVGNYSNTSLAYYEQNTRTWTKFYDGTNSPINFTNKVTIEVDTSGNLWVAEADKLHILKINNPPAWLGSTELQNEHYFSLYPNPGNDLLEVQIDNKMLVYTQVQLVDATGKMVLSQDLNPTNAKQQVQVAQLEKGLYLVQLLDENRVLGTKKWMKL